MGQVEVSRDVVFGTGGGRELRCDVYRPGDVTAPAPAIVLLHGGAWRSGSRAVMLGYGTKLAEAGYVGVASEYRLNGESAWPAHIHDVKAAIRWTRANAAALGVDGDRISILGRSAGGHLALLAAGTPNLDAFEGDGGNPGVSTAVAAAVGIFPPTLMYTGDQRARGGTPARSLLQDAVTDEAARAASPITYVDPSYPPTFLLHGTEDKTVPPSASMIMYEALVAAKVPAELHMYAGQPHGFAGRPEFLSLCASEIVHFLDRYVRVPAAQGETPAQAAGVPTGG